MKRKTPLRIDPAKTKAWQDRSRKNLPRTTPMPQSTEPLPKVNRDRKRRRKEMDEVYGSVFGWVKGRPCILAGHAGHDCRGAVDGHHVKSVGAGGKDAENVVPLCRAAHDEVHSIGWLSFEIRWGVDLDLEAGAVWMRYCDTHAPDSEQ